MSEEFSSLSVRARGALGKLGVTRIEEIQTHTEEDFLTLRNCGRTSVKEIAAFCVLRGVEGPKKGTEKPSYTELRMENAELRKKLTAMGVEPNGTTG